jgi:hypothetical protein
MDHPALLSAVDKLAIAGERAGFSTEQMIRLLNAGFSVDDLLQLIAARLICEDQCLAPSEMPPGGAPKSTRFLN